MYPLLLGLRIHTFMRLLLFRVVVVVSVVRTLFLSDKRNGNDTVHVPGSFRILSIL